MTQTRATNTRWGRSLPTSSDVTGASLLVSIMCGTTLTAAAKDRGISKQAAGQYIARLKKRLPKFRYDRKLGAFVIGGK